MERIKALRIAMLVAQDPLPRDEWMDHIAMRIYYRQLRNERTIAPNNGGLFLLYLWERFISTPYGIYKRQTCKHRQTEIFEDGFESCMRCGIVIHH